TDCPLVVAKRAVGTHASIEWRVDALNAAEECVQTERRCSKWRTHYLRGEPPRKRVAQATYQKQATDGLGAHAGAPKEHPTEFIDGDCAGPTICRRPARRGQPATRFFDGRANDDSQRGSRLRAERPRHSAPGAFKKGRFLRVGGTGRFRFSPLMLSKELFE